MRTLVILLILGVCLFGGIWWLTMQASQDPGHNLGLAFGKVEGDTIEMHMVIFGRTVRLDPPRVDLRTNQELWSEWVQNHFELKDSKGERVKLKRQMDSIVIQAKDITAGTPEFYLIGQLKKGERYDFDYIATLADGLHYRYSFTAPDEDVKLSRPMFKLPEGSE